MTTTAYPQETSALLQGISHHAIWIALSVHCPRMNYQIKDAVINVTDGDESIPVAEDLCQQPRWRLLPAGTSRKFARLEQRARKAIDSRAMNFSALRGVSLLPITKAREVFADIKAIDAEFQLERTEFVARYDRLVTELCSRLPPGVFEQIKKRLPASAAMLQSFGISYMTLPLGGGVSIDQEVLGRCRQTVTDLLQTHELNGQRMQVVELQQFLETLQPDETYKAQLDQEAFDCLAEADRELRSNINNFVEQLASEPRAVIAAAVQNLIQSLQEGRVIRSGTLDQVERAFSLASGFSFMGGDLPALIREGRQLLQGRSPHDLNSDSTLSGQLAAQLQPILQKVSNVQATQQSVRNFRNICLRTPVPATAA